MLIKHGEGKIISVIEEDELNEQQKKAVKKASGELPPQPAPASAENKKSGS